MINTVKIAPSILAADFSRLGEELQRVSEADYIHVDVMDGHFVPNLTNGTTIVEAVKRSTKALVDTHLMVSNPDETFEWYADAGADLVSVHFEAARDLNAIIDRLHERGVMAGVVINPETPVSVLSDVIGRADLIVVMSVNPGFGGQSFIEGTFDKIRELRRMCDERDLDQLIEVDGGVSLANARALCEAGVNVLVAGSAIFKAEDPSGIVREMRELGALGGQPTEE